MRRTSFYDALILGSGPAGCAAAIELARNGHSVAVLDRGISAIRRVGETLAPETTQWLARLGLADAVRAAPGIDSPGVLSLWGGGVPGQTDYLFSPYGSGRHVDRAQFDATLVAAAERAGATFFQRIALRRCQRSEKGVWTIQSVNGPNTFSSPWIVDATGRNAWFLRRQGIRILSADRLVAILACVARPSDSDRRLVLEAVPNGWWYCAPLPGDRAVAAFLTDADLLPPRNQLQSFLEMQRTTSKLVGPRLAPQSTANWRIVRATAAWPVSVSGNGWVAAGDSALAHDPLSGNGICNALASGWNAAHAIIATEPARLDAEAEPARKQYLEQRKRVYRMVTDWPDMPFWQRRAARTSI